MTEDAGNPFASIPLHHPASSVLNDTTPFHLERNEHLAKLELGVLSLILLLDICGNGFVIVVLCLLKRVKKLTRMNRMIAHLTIADLLVGFFNVLPQLAWKATFQFQGGQFLCKFVPYVQLVVMYGSSYVLLATALDRYLAICHPLKMHLWGPRRMNFVVCLAWIVSGVFSLPQVVIFSFTKHPKVEDVSDCFGKFQPEWTLKLYVTWVTSVIYVIPTVLLIVIYSRICYVVWSSATWRRTQQKSPGPHPTPASAAATESVPPAEGSQVTQVTTSMARVQVSHAKVKTVKLTMTVIASYIVCYGPYFVSQMWAAWDDDSPFEESAMVIILLLASLNSCTNPWIYLAFNGHISRYLPLKRTKRPPGRGAPPAQLNSGFQSNSRCTSSTTAPDYTAFESLRLVRL